MSEQVQENTPNSESTEVQETQATTEAPESPWAPSREEWGTMTQALHFLGQKGFFDPNTYEEEEEEEFDPEQADLGKLVQRYVDGRIGEVQPYVEAAAREAGQKRLDELCDSFESRPEVGKLDKSARNAVGFIAESMLSRMAPPGREPDHQMAVYSVYEAAKLVGGLTKAQREEAVKEFKENFRKPPGDPNFGSGERALPAAKSYDEVISRYTGDEEV